MQFTGMEILVVILIVSNIGILVFTNVYARKERKELFELQNKERDRLIKWVDGLQKLWDSERAAILGKWYVKTAYDYQQNILAAKERLQYATRPLDEYSMIAQEADSARQEGVNAYMDRMKNELRVADEDIEQGL